MPPALCPVLVQLWSCHKLTVELLQRRHVSIDSIHFIGKESNRMEEVEEGLVQSAGDVYTEYPNRRRGEWQTRVVPALRKISLAKLVGMIGLSCQTIIDARTGRRRPHLENQKRLEAIVRNLGLVGMRGVR